MYLSLIRRGGLNLLRRLGVLPPFQDDLDGWYKPVDGNDFLESINDNDGKFLPAIAEVDGTTQLQFTDLTGVDVASSDGTSTPSKSGNNIVFTVGTCSNLLLDDGTQIPSVFNGYDVSASANHATVINVILDYTSDGSLYPATNGYSLWQKLGSDDIHVPFDLTGSAIALTPGVDVPAGYTKTRDLSGSDSTWNMADCLVDFDPDDELVEKSINGDFDDWTADDPDNWTVGGESGADPEVSEVGSGEGHGGVGTGACNIYTSGANVSIRQNVLTASVYFRVVVVVSKVNGGTLLVGTAISSSLFGSISTTGTHEFFGTADSAGFILKRSSGMTDITVDSVSIRPSDEREVFNRFNAVIQNALSRASIYYDSVNPYRYHILEITTPNVYTEFFNVGYKGRIFARVRMVLNGNNYEITRYDEELNYATDKTGDDEFRVMKYCKIHPLAMIDENNDAILDEDDYVIIT